jgi:large repetitive protein
LIRGGLYAATLVALLLGAPLALSAPTDQPQPPTIDSKPQSLSTDRSPSFAFSDSDLTVVSFECQLDGLAFVPCTSPQSYSNLVDGSHTFEVKALDAALNASDTTSYTWTVDGTPPPPPTVAGPQAQTNESTATFTLSDTEPGVAFHCRLDKGSFPSCTSPVTYSDLSVGQHTFVVKATDAAGNDSDVVSYTWTIDTSPPPVPTIDSNPPNPSASSNGQFTFSDAENGVGYLCRLDAGVFSTCSSPKSYSNLADGSHSFAVKALDAAGNASGSALYSWLVDTVPPIATLGDKPPLLTNQTGASFTFTSDTPGSTFECSLDGGGFGPCTSPKNYGSLADGTHTFAVQASSLGKAGASATYQWEVDTVAPEPTITSRPNAVSGSSATTFEFTSDEPSTFLCSLDSASFSACTSPKTDNLPDGSHTFAVRAVDAAGNTSQPTPLYTWLIDTVAPEPSITSRPDAVSGSSAATFTFTSDESSTFLCSLDGGSFSACTSPKKYTLADGSHTFALRAVDAAGNTSPSTPLYTWLIDTINPVVTLTDKPASLTNETSASFGFTSNKSPSTFECRLDGGGFTACSAPKFFIGLADGSHTFAVRATSLGNAGPASSYSWKIDTVAPDTAINSGPTGATTSTSATFSFTSGEPGSVFVCSLDSAGFTPCTSAKTYAGLGDGVHTFRVQAVDTAGNPDTTPATAAWTINHPGPETVDHTPPGAVRSLTRTVGYGVLKLSWVKPTDPDFDHVGVVLATSAKRSARAMVYQGGASSYTVKRFKNGLYYSYAVVTYDHAGNASRGVATVVPASILLRSPRDGAGVRTPPRLVWSRVPKASFYNVQLYRGSQKIFSAWPHVAKLTLGRSWAYAGHRYQLKRGTYRWYVWPAFGPRSKARYGQLLGQSTFKFR